MHIYRDKTGVTSGMRGAGWGVTRWGRKLKHMYVYYV